MTESNPIPTAAPVKRSAAAAWIRILLVLTAVVGVFICTVLFDLSASGSGHSLFEGWCKPTSTIDCNHVLLSPWSKIWIIPTAQIGMIYFGCAATWFAFVGIPNRRGRAWQLLPILFVGCGLLGSAMFLFIMSRMPVWCTWCAAAHAANLLLFILAIVGWFVATAEGPARPSAARVGAVAGTSLLIGLVLLLGGAAYQQQNAAFKYEHLYAGVVNNVDYVLWKHETSPHHDISIRDDDLTFGLADATHTLVVFSDFECDGCAYLHRQNNLFGLVANFPKSLRVVFKQYPMCRECNAYIDRAFHVHSCDAAIAAEAALEVGDREAALKYWRLLYENRSRFDENPYDRLAKQAELDPSAFEAARRGETAKQRVKEDIELAHRLGVDGTPALFLDGRRLSQWRIMDSDRLTMIDKDETIRLWRRLLGKRVTSQPAP